MDAFRKRSQRNTRKKDSVQSTQSEGQISPLVSVPGDTIPAPIDPSWHHAKDSPMESRIEMSQRERRRPGGDEPRALLVSGHSARPQDCFNFNQAQFAASRLVASANTEGDGAVVHRLRGRPSNR